MKVVLLMTALLFLGACTEFTAVKKAVATKGAEFSDDALVDAEWWVCYAASIGSVKRRYGATVERAETYKDFCHGDGDADVVAPSE